MAGETWLNQVRHVQDGQPVDAANTARPTVDLEARDNYLRHRIDAAELGEGSVARDVTLSADVLVGQPVFWNRYTQRFEKALAAVRHDAATGSLLPADSAQVRGVVVAKANPTLGDVLTGGRAAVSIANAVSGAAAPGAYYLSTSTPGMLTQQRAPVSVSVLFHDGTYAYMEAKAHDFLESHVHHRFELVCRPCGSDATGGGMVTIPTPDPTLPGWLPAAHASFAGKAPVGASFGYNLAAHPDLQASFPPVPPGSAAVFWDKGSGRLGGSLVPLGLDGLCHVNGDGVWWMSDCAGDVPWPSPFNALSPPSPVPPNSSGGAECPRLEEMRVVLAYTEMVFATDKSVVTSARAAEGSPLTVTDCNGRPASTGALVFDVDLAFLEDPTLVAGDVALKALDPATKTFKQGPVVEGLFAGSGIRMTASRVTNLGTASDPNHLYQGRITVDTLANAGGQELAPVLARVYDARERYLDALNVLYYAFPAGRASFIRFELYAPAAGLPPGPTVAVRALVYGQSAGTLPALAVTAKLLPRPAAGAPVTLAAPPEVTAAFASNVAVGAGQYVEVTSAPLAVSPGDTVLVTVARSATDGYAGEVGLIRLTGVVAGTGGSSVSSVG